MSVTRILKIILVKKCNNVIIYERPKGWLPCPIYWHFGHAAATTRFHPLNICTYFKCLTLSL